MTAVSDVTTETDERAARPFTPTTRLSLHNFAGATIRYAEGDTSRWATIGDSRVAVDLFGTADEIASTLRRLADEVQRQWFDLRSSSSVPPLVEAREAAVGT